MSQLQREMRDDRGVANSGYTVVGLVRCLVWVLTGAAAIVLPPVVQDPVPVRREMVESADSSCGAGSSDRVLRQVHPMAGLNALERLGHDRRVNQLGDCS
jgi:hypothetical protein